jgi:hypothetical protein
MRNPFRYFNSSPEVIRLTVMLYIRYPLSLRRLWWNWFGPMFAAAIRNKRSVVPTDWRSGDETCTARPARGFSRQHPLHFVWFVSH